MTDMRGRIVRESFHDALAAERECDFGSGRLRALLPDLRDTPDIWTRADWAANKLARAQILAADAREELDILAIELGDSTP